MTCLRTADDYCRRMSGMKDACLELANDRDHLINRIRIGAGANFPHLNQIISHRCQMPAVRIPADSIDSTFAGCQ